jgi:hypothetical protein
MPFIIPFIPESTIYNTVCHKLGLNISNICGCRTFLVNLNWKFNEARSKYRGSGAGEKQKARM